MEMVFSFIYNTYYMYIIEMILSVEVKSVKPQVLAEKI
jgi:hypothetical protein